MRPRRFYISIKDFAGGVEVWVPQGTLLSQAAPLEEAPSRDPTFRAQVLDTEEMVKVPSKAVLELSETYARLLQAVTNGEERLGLFKQEELLRRLSVLRRGDQVRVQITSASGEKVRGVVRYRGPVSKNRDEAGIIFGVELVVSEAVGTLGSTGTNLTLVQGNRRVWGGECCVGPVLSWGYWI